jgi:hypothetical protein
MRCGSPVGSALTVLLLLLSLQEMLCIEPAVAGSGPFKLTPGQTWTGSQTLVYKAG